MLIEKYRDFMKKFINIVWRTWINTEIGAHFIVGISLFSSNYITDITGGSSGKMELISLFFHY